MEKPALLVVNCHADARCVLLWHRARGRSSCVWEPGYWFGFMCARTVAQPTHTHARTHAAAVRQPLRRHVGGENKLSLRSQSDERPPWKWSGRDVTREWLPFSVTRQAGRGVSKRDTSVSPRELRRLLSIRFDTIRVVCLYYFVSTASPCQLRQVCVRGDCWRARARVAPGWSCCFYFLQLVARGFV